MIYHLFGMCDFTPGIHADGLYSFQLSVCQFVCFLVCTFFRGIIDKVLVKISPVLSTGSTQEDPSQHNSTRGPDGPEALTLSP